MSTNYSDEELGYIWLDNYVFLSLSKKNELIKYYKNYTNIKENIFKDEDKFKIFMSGEEYQTLCRSVIENHISKIVEFLDKKRIYVICRCNKEYYPEKLMTMNPPFCLYTMGNLDLLKSRYSICIVGSRSPSKYGRDITARFTRTLTQNGFTIVSGMAFGVDCIAHTICLEEGGKTIAVLGSGFDHIYPANHTDLFNKIIASGGLAITEYMPRVSPIGYNFPNRNRIIVGVSNGALITEASEKSGTMYTKNYAIESGTELMVVPGNITSFTSAGCNKIIKEFPSTLVTCEDDIFEVYNFHGEQKIKEQQYYQPSLEEQIIISVIGDEEVHYDEILTKTKIKSKDLNVTLTTLQLKGIIRKLPGNTYELVK